MQQTAPANPHFSRRRPGPRAVTAVAVAALAAGAAGCGGAPEETRRPAAADAPFAGIALAVRCPDPRLAGVLAPLAKTWAARTGAAVEVTAGPMAPGDPADVGVVPFADLGAWADRGELVPVPAAVKDPAHPYQWTGVPAAYRGEPFAGWGGQPFGLPLAGDGLVVAFRADRLADPPTRDAFQAMYGRPLAAPATWEDLADAAAFFADRDKTPSLPPLAADPGRLVRLHAQIAACYDRAAQGDAAPAGADPRGVESLAFQFRLADGRPRLDAPAFVRAAGWFADLKKSGAMPPDGPADPVAALAAGRAVFAVLTFDDVARLNGGTGRVDGRYGIAPAPGTRGYFDPKTGQFVAAAGNYVPHLAGGWLGVVRARSAHPEAAFDLLADLGGPARSVEVLAATGYGPFRDAHFDRERLLAWYGYGFDDGRTKALQDAARSFVGKAVRNPTFGLRTPDQAALTAALAAELERVAAGDASPADGMARAAAAWATTSAAHPPEKVTEWRRKAAGLN